MFANCWESVNTTSPNEVISGIEREEQEVWFRYQHREQNVLKVNKWVWTELNDHHFPSGNPLRSKQSLYIIRLHRQLAAPDARMNISLLVVFPYAKYRLSR